MRVMIVTLGILCVALFLPSEKLPEFVTDYLFQIYIVNLLVLLFAMFLRRIWFSTAFAVFLLIIYAHLASSANLFFNRQVSAEHHIKVCDIERQPLDIEASGMVLLRSGHLNLGHNEPALYYMIEKNLHVFTLVKVDLSRLTPAQRQISLNNLQKFVRMQDDPVIIFGDFGVPAWTPVVKEFLSAAQLEVKNRLLLSGRRSAFNPLAVPQYYVLGFGNIGVDEISVRFSRRLREICTGIEFY